MSQIEPSRHPDDGFPTTENAPENCFKKFLVKFWGVRGLIPTPGEENNRYGGNTACVEMQVGKNNLIFDGGTGLRVLGKDWLRQQPEIVAHLDRKSGV